MEQVIKFFLIKYSQRLSIDLNIAKSKVYNPAFPLALGASCIPLISDQPIAQRPETETSQEKALKKSSRE